MNIVKPGIFGVLALSVAGILPASPGVAAGQEDFFKGKTMHILVGNPPGGSYDFYARLAADMLKAHIPGLGSVVVEDKPGAGGFVAGAALYNEFPKDGTYLAVLPETMAQAQVLNPSATRWQMQNFNMIGSFTPANSVFMLRKGAPVKNVEEMKKTPINVGCTGTTAQSYQYSAALKSLGGFQFKLVCGYRGASDYVLALTRGEIDMVASAWNSWRVTNMKQIDDGDFIPVIQAGVKRVKELPNVPLMQDLVTDSLAKKALEFVSSSAPVGRALFAPPDMPKERVAYLRGVFDKMTSDPIGMDMAKRRRLLLDPTPGAKIQAEIAKIVMTPPDVVKLAESAVKAAPASKAK
jgi:tripartite-type tricarboxylate transporter receptor subunit TctC